MTISSYDTIITALTSMSITGVKSELSYPPASVATADLPLLFPGKITISEEPITFAGGGGWGPFTAEIIIPVVPIGQGTQSQNYTNTKTIVDNLSTALRSLSVGRAKLNWSIEANAGILIADNQYWAVIATIEGRL
jgi:hypothetical protein